MILGWYLDDPRILGSRRSACSVFNVILNLRLKLKVHKIRGCFTKTVRRGKFIAVALSPQRSSKSKVPSEYVSRGPLGDRDCSTISNQFHKTNAVNTFVDILTRPLVHGTILVQLFRASKMETSFWLQRTSTRNSFRSAINSDRLTATVEDYSTLCSTVTDNAKCVLYNSSDFLLVQITN